MLFYREEMAMVEQLGTAAADRVLDSAIPAVLQKANNVHN
jgi:hypothetical protein